MRRTSGYEAEMMLVSIPLLLRPAIPGWLRLSIWRRCPGLQACLDALLIKAVASRSRGCHCHLREKPPGKRTSNRSLGF